MSQKIFSAVQKYVFILFLAVFAIFLLSGFFTKNSDLVIFLYEACFILSFSLLLMSAVAIGIYLVSYIKNYKSDDVDKISFRFSAYSLLRFSISLVLFVVAMALKMFSFAEFFVK